MPSENANITQGPPQQTFTLDEMNSNNPIYIDYLRYIQSVDTRLVSTSVITNDMDGEIRNMVVTHGLNLSNDVNNNVHNPIRVMKLQNYGMNRNGTESQRHRMTQLEMEYANSLDQESLIQEAMVIFIQMGGHDNDPIGIGDEETCGCLLVPIQLIQYFNF